MFQATIARASFTIWAGIAAGVTFCTHDPLNSGATQETIGVLENLRPVHH
jgi:hypothetical protein